MAAMGCFKRLFICSGIYAAMFGIYYLGVHYHVLTFMAGIMAIMLQFVPCLMLASGIMHVGQAWGSIIPLYQNIDCLAFVHKSIPHRLQ